jgi:hypothetical protein
MTRPEQNEYRFLFLIDTEVTLQLQRLILPIETATIFFNKQGVSLTIAPIDLVQRRLSNGSPCLTRSMNKSLPEVASNWFST